MKFFSLALFVCLAPVWAQSPLPNLSDETVIATFEDGVTMTMGEFKRICAVLPEENRKQALLNRPAFLQQWAVMRRLARLAHEDKLDQLSPSKEQLEYYRLMILSQAKMDEAALHTPVLPSEVLGYYETHRDQFRQVRVKAIYVGFNGAKLTEAAAKAKADRLVKQARGGVDFVKLVRENSDDETSRAKDGEFLTLTASDNIPDAVREAIFKLRAGEISDPVSQPNGYYVFRAEEVSFRPFEDARDEIFAHLKQVSYNLWVESVRRDATIRFNSPEFLGAVPMSTFPPK